MNIYLTRHQYKNTQTEDLWAALQEASSKPVGDVMSTWIKQMGFPVVKIKSSVQNGMNRVLMLEQEKFCADGCKPTEPFFWMIPINISTSKSENAYSGVLDQMEKEIVLQNVGADDWVKINHWLLSDTIPKRAA